MEMLSTAIANLQLWHVLLESVLVEGVGLAECWLWVVWCWREEMGDRYSWGACGRWEVGWRCWLLCKKEVLRGGWGWVQDGRRGWVQDGRRGCTEGGEVGLILHAREPVS